jgi:hypothetical protein
MTNNIVSPDTKSADIERPGDDQFLSESRSSDDIDKTGRQRLFPSTDTTYSLFSENKLLLDQD